MKVITTEENILEALDAAYRSGWEERSKRIYEHAAYGEPIVAKEQKPSELAFRANLDLVKEVSRAVSANAQGMEAVARLCDNICWRQ